MHDGLLYLGRKAETWRHDNDRLVFPADQATRLVFPHIYRGFGTWAVTRHDVGHTAGYVGRSGQHPRHASVASFLRRSPLSVCPTGFIGL